MRMGAGAVRFVCSGKGSHQPKELGLLGYMPDMGAELTQALRDSGLTEEALQRGIDNRTIIVFFDGELEGADRGIYSPLRGFPEEGNSVAWRFRCPCCQDTYGLGRVPDVRIAHATLVELMRQLRESGISKFDLRPRLVLS